MFVVVVVVVFSFLRLKLKCGYLLRNRFLHFFTKDLFSFFLLCISILCCVFVVAVKFLLTRTLFLLPNTTYNMKLFLASSSSYSVLATTKEISVKIPFLFKLFLKFLTIFFFNYILFCLLTKFSISFYSL